jgi:hypothetical protein
METRSPVLLSGQDAVAAERGRLMAARAIAENPEQRAAVERACGIEYCKRTYPEAYRSGFRNLLDHFKFW